MVRVGGAWLPDRPGPAAGQPHHRDDAAATGELLEPDQNYVRAAGQAVNEGTEAPPIWEVVENHIRAQGTVTLEPNNTVDVVGG